MANIFLLEDDNLLNKGISIALQKDNHTVTAAYSYLEALQNYQTQKYDLFLLDISLPDGSGLKLCQKIRETSDTPVLFLTANDTEEDMLSRFLGAVLILMYILLFLLDFLHNRYDDDLLEKITLLIESLTEQQETYVFTENTDTLTARLQHQLLKLRNILIAQNQLLAQEKDQIKTLISDISHQIKTPVAAANTFAQLLDGNELSFSEQTEYIAALQTTLDKLTFLTNSLIKMSRLESGIIRLKPEWTSLNAIILQAIKTVYAQAKEKNSTITFDCPQEFEATLDFNWTTEAVTNVLDNAVKYTPCGGMIQISITEYPSYLRLDICDNGPGIPEAEQAKIFNRFYRGTHSAGADGVGIGLYLTRDIITKQHGYVKVSSTENGSLFSLFLKKE